MSVVVRSYPWQVFWSCYISSRRGASREKSFFIDGRPRFSSAWSSTSIPSAVLQLLTVFFIRVPLEASQQGYARVMPVCESFMVLRSLLSAQCRRKARLRRLGVCERQCDPFKKLNRVVRIVEMNRLNALIEQNWTLVSVFGSNNDPRHEDLLAIVWLRMAPVATGACIYKITWLVATRVALL